MFFFKSKLRGIEWPTPVVVSPLSATNLDYTRQWLEEWLLQGQNELLGLFENFVEIMSQQENIAINFALVQHF